MLGSLIPLRTVLNIFPDLNIKHSQSLSERKGFLLKIISDKPCSTNALFSRTSVGLAQFIARMPPSLKSRSTLHLANTVALCLGGIFLHMNDVFCVMDIFFFRSSLGWWVGLRQPQIQSENSELCLPGTIINNMSPPTECGHIDGLSTWKGCHPGQAAFLHSVSSKTNISFFHSPVVDLMRVKFENNYWPQSRNKRTIEKGPCR